MILELFIDQLTSSLVEAVWNRPEIAGLRQPIEERLSARTFKDKTRRALAAFGESSNTVLPGLNDKAFIGQREVQRCLSDYIVAGKPADLERFLILYARHSPHGEKAINDRTRQAIKTYFDHLREAFASDSEFGPVLAARDQKSMLQALDTINVGFTQVQTQVAQLTQEFQALRQTKAFQQLERRSTGIPDLYERDVVPILAQAATQGTDLKAAAVEALGEDSPLLTDVSWSGTDQQVAEELCAALGTHEGYPGRVAIVAVLISLAPSTASELRPRLYEIISILKDLLEGRARSSYVEEGLIYVAHSNKKIGQRLATNLRTAGLNVWIDIDAVQAGQRMREQRFTALERAETVIGCLTTSALQDSALRRVLSSAWLLHKRILIVPFDPVDLRIHEETAPLADLVPVEFETPASAADAVIAALTTSRVTRNPYKGLEAFDETDAPYYFGHEDLINRLKQLVANAGGFAAVTGASGSGKSSLVRAGLLPALRAQRWRIAVFRPGARPLHELAGAVASLAGKSELEVLENLGQPHASLTSYLSDVRAALIVDQFEEAFTQSKSDDARAFIQLISDAANNVKSEIIIVLTLRSDYIPFIENYGPLARLVEARSVIVSRMEADDIRRSIYEPARIAGLIPEAGLAERILSEIEGESAVLPLLQFALSQLYMRREENRLTIRAYESIGGLRDALALHAEGVFSRMNAQQQSLVRRLMLELVAEPTGNEYARSRRRRSDLYFDGISDDDVQTLIDYLAASGNRLLTVTRDEHGTAWIEVSHEALLNRWFRCRQWIGENQQALTDRARFEAEAQAWLAAGRDSSYLRTGVRLAEAQDWLYRGSEFVSGAQQAYIEAAQQRDKVRRQSLRKAFIGAVALAGLALIFGIVALLQSQSESAARLMAEQSLADAELSMLESKSGQLALQAILEAQTANYDVALLLAAEAVETGDILAARSSILTILQNLEELKRYLHGHEGIVHAVRYSPDGQFLATAGEDMTVRIWNESDGSLIGELQGHQASISDLAFTDNETLLSSDQQGIVIRWNILTSREVGRIDTGDLIYAIAAVPDGGPIATAHRSAGVQIWQPDGTLLFALDDLTEVLTLAFSNDGSILAVADTAGGGAIQLREPASNYSLIDILEGHTNWVHALEFSPDGRQLASGGADAIVRIWDVETGQQTGEPFREHEGWVRSIAYSEDGMFLASTGDDGRIVLRRFESGVFRQMANRLGHRGTVYDYVFHPQKVDLGASAGEDGKIAQWGPAEEISRSLEGHTGDVYRAIWSNDGTKIITAGTDRTVLIWDANTGRILNDQITASGQVIALAANDNTLVYGDDAGQIQVWDMAASNMIGSLDMGVPVRAVALSADATRLATGSDDMYVRLWDMEDLVHPLMEMAGHSDWINTVDFSADDSKIVSGGADGKTLVWDISTQSPLAELAALHTDQITSAKFSPDSTILATSSRDGTVRLWSATEFSPVGLPMEQDGRWVSDLAFAPDGGLLATVTHSGNVQLWDWNSQQSIGLPLSGHTDWIWSVDFRSDSLALLTGSRDRTARIWSIDVDDWQAQACEKANRLLFSAEANRYLGGDLASGC